MRPIPYCEVQERKLARLQKYHIEVGKVSSQSISQSFYSNDESKNLMALLGRENEIILVDKRKKSKETI